MAKKAETPKGTRKSAKAKPPAKKPAAKKPAAKPSPPPASQHRDSKRTGRLRTAQIAKDIELLKKRNRIIDLKESGASIRQISELLIKERKKELLEANEFMPEDVAEFEASQGNKPTRVHELLCEALDDLHKNQLLNTKRHVTLELSKLEKQELALYTNAIRLADLDKHRLKLLEHFHRTSDMGGLVGLLKEGGFYADEVEKYNRSLDRIWKRRDSLLGLNKPVKHEHTGEDGKPIETMTVTRVILPAAVDDPIPEE